MHSTTLTAEQAGLQLPQYSQVALTVLELFEGEPVRNAAILEAIGKHQRRVTASLFVARKNGLVELTGRSRQAGYVPTAKLRKVKDELDKRQCTEVAGGLGSASRRATGAA